ncbi:hypothetical protein [Parasphingorhabdus sp.]|uniref:hypothetical protein n=1 Tax=Parasphingorhabdus sp. TaxID=2709688 RepID=UPI0035941838
MPEETLNLTENGTVNSTIPDTIVFKDDDGSFRPVCPFFEVHGTWELDGRLHEGPITKTVLADNGLDLAEVRWTVTLGNLKAYHFTLDEGDRISATVTIAGNDTTRHQLEGSSPDNPGLKPLIATSSPMPMGEVQLAQPTDDDSFPELRLRFYPPAGLTYGPANLEDKLTAAANARLDPQINPEANPSVWNSNSDWFGFDLPAARKIVNKDSHWARLNLNDEGPPPVGAGDPRNAPSGLSASLYELRGSPQQNEPVRISMGLVDDVSDGIVQCEIGGIIASGRIAIGPPDFAPMNRPFTSLQDGLSDRVLRDEFRDNPPNDEELEAIVADIFERALETSELMNKDAQNDRSRGTNFDRNDPATTDLPPPRPEFESNPRATLWASSNPNVTTRPAPTGSLQVDAMPVSFQGQRKHRRYNAIEYLRDRLREEPDLIEKWMRPPRDSSPLFDRRMPALMRGSDGDPMHVTRRQMEMIRLWASKQSGDS